MLSASVGRVKQVAAGPMLTGPRSMADQYPPQPASALHVCPYLARHQSGTAVTPPIVILSDRFANRKDPFETSFPVVGLIEARDRVTAIDQSASYVELKLPTS